MNLAPFQDTPFDDAAAFDDFKMSLQQNHNKIAQKLFAQSKFYKTYPLVDSVEHQKDWQQNLQQELQSIYALIPLTGLADFSGADLSKQDEFEDFMNLLIFVERRINVQLGIT